MPFFSFSSVGYPLGTSHNSRKKSKILGHPEKLGHPEEMGHPKKWDKKIENLVDGTRSPWVPSDDYTHHYPNSLPKATHEYEVGA